MIEVFRARKFYLPELWLFGYLHNDLSVIAEYERASFQEDPYQSLCKLPIF